MAYDPSAEAALERIRHSSSDSFGHAFPIVGYSEYELKLGFTPKAVKPMSPKNALPLAEHSFYGLMHHFNSAADNNALAFNPDPIGAIPNDYVLVSLGLDTVKTLPAAEFFLNDMQFRLRFPMHVHNASNDPYSKISGHIDANLKNLLSCMAPGEHRLELETEIENPMAGLSEFKTKLDTPSFMHCIDDSHLRLSEVCMTSRTGFFIVTSIPGTDAHVLLHGCFDYSRYTTPGMEVYTSPMPRIEIEFEAKYFLGDSPALADEAVQRTYINRVFDKLTTAAQQHHYAPFTRSKMEDAAHSVSRFYEAHAPGLQTANSPLASHLNKQQIPHYLAYALTQGRSVSDVFNSLKNHGLDAPISRLASGMPDPQQILTRTNPFEQNKSFVIA